MNILHLISSPRGAASFSIKLGNAIVSKLKAAHPGSEVHEVDLTRLSFPHLEEVHLNSFFTAPESRSPELTEAVRHSDTAIGTLMAADLIVIGVPMYNFSIHSTLKAWIDHIARAGKTFTYAGGTPEGLVKNKKVYLAISTGAVYSEGPWKSFDFTEPYLRTMLGFLGMTDITAIRVEGLNMPELKEYALDKAIGRIAV